MVFGQALQLRSVLEQCAGLDNARPRALFDKGLGGDGHQRRTVLARAGRDRNAHAAAHAVAQQGKAFQAQMFAYYRKIDLRLFANKLRGHPVCARIR